MNSRIPSQYQQFWGSPMVFDRPLVHITTQENFFSMRQTSGIKAQDPAPNYWRGIKCVFLSDPLNIKHQENFKAVCEHIKKKGTDLGLVILELIVPYYLYPCLDEVRSNQVICLQDIRFDDSKVILNVFDC